MGFEKFCSLTLRATFSPYKDAAFFCGHHDEIKIGIDWES